MPGKAPTREKMKGSIRAPMKHRSHEEQLSDAVQEFFDGLAYMEQSKEVMPMDSSGRAS